MLYNMQEGIVYFWLVPVELNIFLPLAMLLAYGAGKLLKVLYRSLVRAEVEAGKAETEKRGVDMPPEGSV